MQQNIHFITIATRDLDAARTFYVDGLGWTPHLDVADEIIFFQVAPGLLLGLFAAEKFAADGGIAVSDLATTGLTLSHNVDSPSAVDHLVARLVELGATVTKPPQPSAFGGIYHAHLRDPNGVAWEIAHNPTWHIDPDGTVVL
jgi:catechol 2,3-dioxygenase-like lactoylglutathione lyase family enzyme